LVTFTPAAFGIFISTIVRTDTAIRFFAGLSNRLES
jgi:hypothetical protein